VPLTDPGNHVVEGSPQIGRDEIPDCRPDSKVSNERWQVDRESGDDVEAEVRRLGASAATTGVLCQVMRYTGPDNFGRDRSWAGQPRSYAPRGFPDYAGLAVAELDGHGEAEDV
jgi:hypothetical protein